MKQDDPLIKAGITIVHYNIKELDSNKLKNLDPQLRFVRDILKKHPSSILSLNEIQYDLPNVPSPNFTSKGTNLERFAGMLGMTDFNSIFYPANTGMNAKKDPTGNYYPNAGSSEARASADQVNFGVFPGQYSSGALSQFKPIYTKVISKLKWKAFNPSIDLTQFTDSQGNPLPEDMELFDKNFTDAVVKMEGREVHIILLHTVPSFGFGNSKTPNFLRNRDQLRFLEWYLTGETDIEIDLAAHDIHSLDNQATYIAMGDWNTSVFNKKQPGSLILESLFAKGNLWMDLNEEDFTNESSGFRQKPMRLLLDYILFSKDIEPLAGEILKPTDERIELGCDSTPLSSGRDDMELVSYMDNKKKCYAEISKSNYNYKMASDHFPLKATFKFK